MPGKIIKIDGDKAMIEYPANQLREASIIEGDYKVGDYVFVTAQIIVQRLSEEEALESLEAWKHVA
ncbi:MAG: HypC/HybG/HupF family hydrogenase formation chaperone [Candidatus Woesearchaeota archaeon]